MTIMKRPAMHCGFLFLLLSGVVPAGATDATRPVGIAPASAGLSGPSLTAPRGPVPPESGIAPARPTPPAARPPGSAGADSSTEQWSRLLTGTWEYRAVDKAGRQVEITTIRFLPGGEYQTHLLYGAFKAEALSRGHLRIAKATDTEAELLLTPADKDPERLGEESTLTSRVRRVDANRLRAADGSELLRRP